MGINATILIEKALPMTVRLICNSKNNRLTRQVGAVIFLTPKSGEGELSLVAPFLLGIITFTSSHH